MQTALFVVKKIVSMNKFSPNAGLCISFNYASTMSDLFEIKICAQGIAHADAILERLGSKLRIEEK